jgi:hypothetical protein
MTNASCLPCNIRLLTSSMAAAVTASVSAVRVEGSLVRALSASLMVNGLMGSLGEGQVAALWTFYSTSAGYTRTPGDYSQFYCGAGSWRVVVPTCKCPFHVQARLLSCCGFQRAVVCLSMSTLRCQKKSPKRWFSEIPFRTGPPLHGRLLVQCIKAI